MLLLVLLTVTMSLAADEEKIVNNYVVKIKNDILTNVQPTEKSSHVLDLSGLGLRVLEKDAFNNLVTLKNLSLANNSLSSIPGRTFSKLENLEHLSLANNNISNFRDVFVGLGRLKTLNISYNPKKKMRYSEFYGLPKSSVVFTEGLTFLTINSHVFEKVSPDRGEMDEDAEGTKDTYEELIECARQRNKKPAQRIKVCIDDGVLILVDTLEKDETLPSGCRELQYDRTLSLENLGISKFQRGWCRFQSKSLGFRLNLAGNEIVNVTREMLDDLPENINGIDLSRNKIERLQKDIIDHKFIFMNLSHNRISEIEDGAFSKTNLRDLYMSDNLLKDTKFMSSLPTTIEDVHLGSNKITEISAGSFPNLHRLQYIHLKDNLIQELKADSFHGLPSLTVVELSNNQISHVERGCFHGFPILRSVMLSNNNLTSFKEGTFDGVESIAHLYLGYNKLSNANEFFRNGLPPNLFTLECDYNDIEKLERGAFKNLPKYRLILDGNKISNIEHGVFDLPSLTMLSLNSNNLKEVDGDSFQGVNDLRRLSLVGNGIATIPKRFAKHFGKLRELDLGHNPIKKLENGALYGLNKTEPSLVHLDHVPVEIIEAGLFDDL